jgi:hypothetical protein
MRFLLIVLFIGLVCGGLQLFFPWWTCAATSFIIALIIAQKPSSAFWAGFWAVFLLWGGYAAWIDYNTNSYLTNKIIQLFSIPSPYLMILLTAVVGGFTSGLAAITGSYLRRIFTTN